MRLPKPLLRDNPNVNKYDFGHVLVVAGSAPMLGAAALVATAAMRMGAGLVTCLIHKDLNLTLQKKIPNEVMTLPYRRFSDFKDRLNKFSVVAIGPGLGQKRHAVLLVRYILKNFKGPMVIDADALNILSQYPKWWGLIQGQYVMTPHSGEMARLMKLKRTQIDADRTSVAKQAAFKFKANVVLKGNRTVIATSEGKVYINTTGNSSLAKAGFGDVLTGMIAALLAQKIDIIQSCRFAVFRHGLIADRITGARRYNLQAENIIKKL